MTVLLSFVTMFAGMTYLPQKLKQLLMGTLFYASTVDVNLNIRTLIAHAFFSLYSILTAAIDLIVCLTSCVQFDPVNSVL